MIVEWNLVTASEPPDGVVVEVSDNGGTRLIRQGNLWFLPDHSMYVYYTPTLWRPVADTGMTTTERQNLRIALLGQDMKRTSFTNDDGTGVYSETWERDGATIVLTWGPKRKDNPC